ncbi:MAG: hypothetical protein ACYDCN_11515 [Bacteroidia bacterium]
MIHKLICLLLAVVIISSCKRDKEITQPSPCSTIAPVVVFKYKHDSYHGLVRVPYSSSAPYSVAGIPDPKRYADTGKIETKLINDYWVDDIGQGTAVTSITYTQYAGYTSLPSASFLASKIIDTLPFIEYYNCSNLAGRDTASLNNLIRTNKLNQCGH